MISILCETSHRQKVCVSVSGTRKTRCYPQAPMLSALTAKMHCI
jgi:hypothetical protein